MSKMEDRLADYRSLRNASKKVLLDDIEHARTTFSAKGLSNRYLGGVIEGGKDVYEVAKVHTVDNRGIIAIVLGALALWFGREPLLAAMAEESGAEESGPEEIETDELEPEPEGSGTAHEPPEMSDDDQSPGDTDDR